MQPVLGGRPLGRRVRRAGASLIVGLLCWVGPTGGAQPVAAPEPLAKVLVERDGVVRVTDAGLRAAGFDLPDLAATARLRLRLRGQDVPIRVLSAGLPEAAGRFAFDFVGRFPRGTKTYEDEFNAANVYLLDLAPADERPARFTRALSLGPSGAAADLRSTPLRVHHEVNRKLMRFSGNQLPDETWYWQLSMASDTEPKALTLPLRGVDPSRAARLRVRFQGYSSLPQEPDHYVDVTWNGQSLGQAVWDGQKPLTFERELPPGGLRDGDNTLTFHVRGDQTGGVDVVLLDWVELDYARRLIVSDGAQVPFNATPLSTGQALSVETTAGGQLEVFDSLGRVLHTTRPGQRSLRVRPLALPSVSPAPASDVPPDNNRYWALRAGDQLPPAHIQVSRPADLRAVGAGAEFLIVAHADFLPAAERLAARRRSQGLSTRVVDVADVYDRFADGFIGPAPIRDFLKHTYKTWQPRPRYVLLFGDASWDYKNRQVDDADYPDHLFMPDAWNATVPKIPSTPLKPGDTTNDRQRVPTFQWQSPWGHAASDNFFACVDGDDDLPDIGVGRITAGTVAEAEAAVDKIVTWEQANATSQGRHGALFLTDQYLAHQRQSDRLSELATGLGYSTTKIYPQPDEKDNAGNSVAIKAAFDAGQSLVVFAGHGGRYIWRTGPPDPTKNHDLFTLEHLDELRGSAQIPVVVSLTCYSAPFDHPTADSIGEKMLRLRDKGAIAIVASSWRNVPPFSLAEFMLTGLSEPGQRLGEAFRLAMRQVGLADSLHSYNLLGDPSLPFVPPLKPAALAADPKAPQPASHN
jgi:hypothetical protein